ncbi:aryl-alcohol dehydrogenase [Marinomonas ushuaiensis DSM 15871]|uniref:Aryl-alcohol dehydrogenase n=1 Tax=Marinomonas ushuaiensis DSM 15871 TaxID=1122207 RepID=X7E6P9_9GAMM|nr:aldo/keto reductase [Marinomonas ushuaiensis]ETX10828.1 aryl-alcohol dehydrogenase [Marinomonas ushuaiensis DSM 15871]
MKLIQLGKSDVQLSRLVYGVWRLADAENTSTAHVREKIDLCLDQGITSFDHADIYGDYECERLFGQALAQDPSLRSKIQLISKCDIAIPSDKYPQRQVKYYDTSAAYIQMSVENSLKNLHTDYLDLLLIHRPDPFMNAAETGKTLDALIDSGKVRAVGISNFEVWDWRLLQSHMKHPLVVNQVEMSLLNRDVFTNGTLSAIQLDGLTPMAWSPLAGGALFQDSVATARLAPIFERICQQQNCSIDQAAVAWLLAHPANILPIVGTNHPERIKTLSKAMDVQIDRETWFEMLTAAAGHEVP